MQSFADVLKAGQATTERVKLLLPFGLAERQARFVASVMFHAGCSSAGSTLRSPGSHTEEGPRL